jgi:Prokaryotic dksA/traR C4-type zinc finger
MAPVKTGANLAFEVAILRLGELALLRPPADGAVSRERRETTMAIQQRSCKRCGEKISARRLEVLPNTRLCRDCSEEIGGDFKTYAVPEHTGKPGSLKRNYGSWSVVRKPRQITRKDAE